MKSKGFEKGQLNRASDVGQRLSRAAGVVLLLALGHLCAYTQNKYEDRHIGKLDLNVAGVDANNADVEQYRLTVTQRVGTTYSTPRIREAIQDLYDTKKIETVSVAAVLDAGGDVQLVFNIKPKTQASKVNVVVSDTASGDKVTEQELLFKLSLLTPGTPVTEQTLKNNADEILTYLRDRGFYKSQVTYTTRPLPHTNEVGVTFTVTPNDQATVSSFIVNIQGYDKPIPPDTFKLKPGEPYSRDRLTADVTKVRDLLKKEKFYAPELEDPVVRYDSDVNKISVVLAGKVGPKVEVIVKAKVSSANQTRLLPIKREGTLDYASIIEGQRRLENYYQEQGYFFAKVTPVCSVTPPITDVENNPIQNETGFLCSFLGSEDLMGRAVQVKYNVDLNRKFRLTEIRLEGTDKITIDDVKTVLGTQEANILGIIPLFGYGRGYTSASILADDAATIKSIMVQLGYRQAQVHVNQGVSTNGDDLIITFVVEEGVPTVVNNVTISGNTAIPTDELTRELPVLTGQNFSRARLRNASRKLSEYYSSHGYYYARVTPQVTEGPADPGGLKQTVNVEFRVQNEGKQVVVNRVLVGGNEKTKTNAILKAVTLKPGDLLRSTDVYTSEQNLYGSDAFSRVDIKPQPAGTTADGKQQLNDVIVTVEEQAARLLSYGGGFSTDLGASGFFDIRHVNLFGKLWQGGARVSMSQRQQLIQLDFIDPRFIHDGEKRFSPLTISATYQRDSTVTRFFRTTFDKGTFGIVQRVDDKGNPIDEFGKKTGSPTINRLSLTAETSRTISRQARSKVFVRYRFEDVRLFKFESLLVKDLLRPDAVTRISGISSTFVRDTRRNCSVKYSLLDLISKGEQTEPCRYNASDPTNGQFLTADYSLSLPALGANIGFEKFQASYNYYYSFPRLRNLTLAARGIIGLGHVFSGAKRFESVEFPALNGLLPISERFFAGGSYTLRGFDTEEAGPRVAVVPQGTFRDSKGKQVFLPPFTIPFGGNALAVVNLEARVPITKSFRVVPFYDGGNVFRKAGDIFKKPQVISGDVMSVNQRAVWTHTIGMGLRIKTPIGGEFGVDYGRLLNPPIFLVPQAGGPNAELKLKQDHIHFRFSQAF